MNADIVGSVVLPVLGAVPDGAIVLFSGMGAVDVVEQQVNPIDGNELLFIQIRLLLESELLLGRRSCF